MNLAAFLLESPACRAPWRAKRSLQFYGARLSSNPPPSGGTDRAAGYCYPVEAEENLRQWMQMQSGKPSLGLPKLRN